MSDNIDELTNPQDVGVKIPFKFILLAAVFVASFVFIKKFAAVAEKGVNKVQKNPKLAIMSELEDKTKVFKEKIFEGLKEQIR